MSEKSPKMEAYPSTYFTGSARDGEAIRFAVSTNGFKFRALNQNLQVLSSAVISSKVKC